MSLIQGIKLFVRVVWFLSLSEKCLNQKFLHSTTINIYDSFWNLTFGLINIMSEKNKIVTYVIEYMKGELLNRIQLICFNNYEDLLAQHILNLE